MTLLEPKTTAELHGIIHWGGVLNVIAFGFLVPISYGLAVVTPFQLRQTEEITALQSLAKLIPGLSASSREAVQAYLAGNSPLAEPFVGVAAYAFPLLVATAVFCCVFLAIRRSQSLIDEAVLSLLIRWAVAFALVNVLVYPMFTQDFWLSVVWGRMILEGQNPYYEFFTPSALAGTPLLNFPLRMTYGPLWGIVSALVAFLGQGSVVLEFLFFKLVLTLSWILSLLLIHRILASAPLAERARGISFFGWLPVSFHVSVGEGHNDIVMILFFLLWVDLAVRRIHWLSPIVLTISVLMKYVAAPMAFVELLHAWKGRQAYRTYFLTWVASAGLGAAVFAVFWQGPGFFAPLLKMQADKFLTPAHALFSAASFLQIRIPWWFAWAVFGLLFAAVAAHYSLRYFRHPGSSELTELILAIQCAILFAGVGHVWPWFILWVLAPAAIAIRSKLLRLVAPAAVLGPFLHLYWMLAPGWRKLHYASVAFYVLLLGGAMLLTWISVREARLRDGCSSPSESL